MTHPQTLTDVLDLARSGYRVVILTDGVLAARELLEAHAAPAFGALAVERSPGRMHLHFTSGGQVRYASFRSGLRGSVADVVCLPPPLVVSLRREASYVTATSSRPGAGLYVYGSDGSVAPDDRGVADLECWMRTTLGITVEPWQRRLLQQVVTGRDA